MSDFRQNPVWVELSNALVHADVLVDQTPASSGITVQDELRSCIRRAQTAYIQEHEVRVVILGRDPAEYLAEIPHGELGKDLSPASQTIRRLEEELAKHWGVIREMRDSMRYHAGERGELWWAGYLSHMLEEHDRAHGALAEDDT